MHAFQDSQPVFSPGFVQDESPDSEHGMVMSPRHRNTNAVLYRVLQREGRAQPM